MKINIKQTARNNKNWSLYKLAKEMGLPQQTVYSWANGRTQPNYPNMDLLCAVLNCMPNDLFEPEIPGNLEEIRNLNAVKQIKRQEKIIENLKKSVG